MAGGQVTRTKSIFPLTVIIVSSYAYPVLLQFFFELRESLWVSAKGMWESAKGMDSHMPLADDKRHHWN